MPAYIPDGYTQDGYIAERKGAWEPVRFQFRLLGYNERRRVIDGVAKSKPEDSARIVFETIKRQVLSWDLRIAANDEKPLPIDLETIKRLHPQLIDSFFNIVAGYETPDADPNNPDAESKLSAVNLDAIFGDKAPGDVLIEGAIKN